MTELQGFVFVHRLYTQSELVFGVNQGVTVAFALGNQPETNLGWAYIQGKPASAKQTRPIFIFALDNPAEINVSCTQVFEESLGTRHGYQGL